MACFKAAQARAARPLPYAEVTAKLADFPVFDAHRAGVGGLRDFLLQARWREGRTGERLPEAADSVTAFDFTSVDRSTMARAAAVRKV